jgi:hypothetical protein
LPHHTTKSSVPHTFTLQVFHTLHVCKSTWKAHISMTTFFECPNSNENARNPTLPKSWAPIVWFHIK